MNKLMTVLALTVVGIINHGIAGDWSLTTSPPYQTDSGTHQLYLAISKYDANATGVSFSATATPGTGSVSDWYWSFTNGTPDSYSGQTPPTVTFGAAAYGVANTCDAGFYHSGSEGESCSYSGPFVTVNVIKPILEFRTSGSWSSDDSAHSSYNPSMAIGIKFETTSNGKFSVLCPYEYKYTIQPDNSGAVTSDMDIYETATFKDTYYKGSTKFSDPPASSETPVNYTSYGNYNYTTVTAPENPIMYAVDAPGTPEYDAESNMSLLECNKYVFQAALKSYPTYHDASDSHLDEPAAKTHLFTVTCISTASDGSGPYTWTVTP